MAGLAYPDWVVITTLASGGVVVSLEKTAVAAGHGDDDAGGHSVLRDALPPRKIAGPWP